MTQIAAKDIALINLGRAQMAQANIEINTSAQFRAIAKIKETKAYKGLSAISPTGEVLTVSTFEQFCIEHVGMSRQHVDRNLKLLEQLGDEGFQAGTGKNLGYRELVKISRLPPDMKEEAVTTLISEDSDKEMILEVVEDLFLRLQEQRTESAEKDEENKGLITDLAQRDVELKNEQLKSTALQKRLLNRANVAPYPEFVMGIRDESAAMADKAMLAFDDLNRMNEQLREAAAMQDGANVNIALISLYTHVNAVIARGLTLQKEMQDCWGIENLAVEITGKHLHDTDEIEEHLSNRAVLIQEHEFEKRVRDNQREAAKPRGRGRPRKPK